ncbi:uncharacterized protein Smp_200690 [Schistosoma mansoni]|uniref:uncharacterized protein n=1 Tax=Schistosoma mansoni TaxID=6183 RepID=UPI00022DC7B2|nr:uncharacterized protein Smp_200690 [Schistosoma mansoni]|eukprot:XP_018648044.1 uncharacterized protein Smp_200690 [Schistosoma mansoni]
MNAAEKVEDDSPWNHTVICVSSSQNLVWFSTAVSRATTLKNNFLKTSQISIPLIPWIQLKWNSSHAISYILIYLMTICIIIQCNY